MEYIAVENTGRRSHGRPIFRLTRPLRYDPRCPDLPIVEAPQNFHTDFASSGRWFWRIFAPWDALEPSAIHDYCYRVLRIGRKKSDRIFLIAMKDYRVVRWRRWIGYLMVRGFGWLHYGKMEKLS